MFTRKTMEEMVARMIRWSRGTTKNITDYRPGSKIRTLYEAVALNMEEFYDRIFRTMRLLIEENIYAIFNFDKLSSTAATGIVRFSRTVVADRDYPIAENTLLQTLPTNGRAPMNYRTTSEAILRTGTTYVDVPVVCELTGEVGNTGANTITVVVGAIPGIDSVTNPVALTNGEEEETKEAQKTRFQRFIDANARAVLESIEYGATLATVTDGNGAVTERVVQAKAFEDLPARKGEVDVYVWNGVNGASNALLDEARKHITGYYTEDGTRIYGYKSAGIWLNMYAASTLAVRVRVVLHVESWYGETEALNAVHREITNYFTNLVMGQTVVQSEVQARVQKLNSGVIQSSVQFATGSNDYATSNITVSTAMLAVLHPTMDIQVTVNTANPWEDF